MEQVKYAELSAMIACGKLDCLKNCCDSLMLVQAVLKDMTPRDVALLQQMLCGCASNPGGGSAPQNPSGQTTNTCFISIMNWVVANRGAFIAMEGVMAGVVASVSGKVDPETTAILVALTAALEAIREVADDAVKKPNDPGLIQRGSTLYCQILNAEFSLENKLKSIAGQGWTQDLLNMLDQVNPAKLIDKSCCTNAPASTTTTPPGTVPATWTDVPVTTPVSTGGTGTGLPTGGATPIPTSYPSTTGSYPSTTSYPSGLVTLTPFTPQTVPYPGSKQS